MNDPNRRGATGSSRDSNHRSDTNWMPWVIGLVLLLGLALVLYWFLNSGDDPADTDIRTTTPPANVDPARPTGTTPPQDDGEVVPPDGGTLPPPDEGTMGTP